MDSGYLPATVHSRPVQITNSAAAYSATSCSYMDYILKVEYVVQFSVPVAQYDPDRIVGSTSVT